MPGGGKTPLTDSQWADIKAARIAGVSREDLASTYGVSPDAIRKHEVRKRWPTAECLRQESRRLAALADSHPGSQPVRSVQSPSPASGQAPGQPPDALSLSLGLVSGEVYATSLSYARRAAQAVRSWTVPVPATVKEGISLMHSARRIVGLDSQPGAMVAIQIHASGERRDGRTIEIEAAGDVAGSSGDPPEGEDSGEG
jgi:hypothetical protein